MRGVVHMMAELDILNGFVSKVISDCIDISINAIRKADKNRKLKNQTMETRIYQMTVDALNAFPYNKYKKDEKVYDAVESILNELKRGNGDYKESVRLGLNMLSAEITGDICGDFLGLLCYEICKEENRDLAIGYIIHQGERISEQQQQMDRYMQEGFEENNQNHEETHRKLDYLIEKQNEKDIQGVKYLVKSPIVNRADEYVKRWDKNVFLNNFNKRDKDAGVNIKLQEIYPEKNLPHYKWKSNDESLTDLKELLREYIIDNDDKKMLLILGQAGIGKSTLITWIMANLVEKEEDILVYQFASDLGDVNWQDDNILDEIFATIDLEYDMLEGKTLILDGFDEISVKENRERILHKLNQELEKKNYLRKFSLVLTCRENYVKKAWLEGIEYITLQAWDGEQIRSFCEVYEEAIISKVSDSIVNKNLEVKIGKIIEKKDIMGIPLILYIVLALKVDIERSSSVVDVYDQIFSLEAGGIYGGIYDRGYDAEHRINDPRIRKHIHYISQKIAFWIFENNADRATISHKKFEEICDVEMSKVGEKGEDIQRDILIGNFFKLKYCEGKGTDELQFIHRSIYEYFVVLYFFEVICNVTSKEETAGKPGELLKDGKVSKQMLKFMEYKFSSLQRCAFPDSLKDIFQIMLQDGMTYHAKERYKNIIVKEENIFSNMLEPMHLWDSELGVYDDKIIPYLRYNNMFSLNLQGIKLRAASMGGINLIGADLRDADLRDIDLSGANLISASLSGADLNGANLSGANLIGVDFTGVNLNGADLNGANLSEAIFDEETVNWLCLERDLNESRVYLFETDEILDYMSYCFIKEEERKGENDCFL